MRMKEGKSGLIWAGVPCGLCLDCTLDLFPHVGKLCLCLLRWVWVSRSVHRRTKRDCNGDTRQAATRIANLIAMRTVLLLLLAEVLGIPWIAARHKFSVHVSCQLWIGILPDPDPERSR